MSAPPDLFVHALSHSGSRVEMPSLGSESDLQPDDMTDENTVTESKKPGLGKERHEPRSPRVPWRHSARVTYGQTNGFLRSRRCTNDSEKGSFKECFPIFGVCCERKPMGDEPRKPPDELPVLLVQAFLLLHHSANVVPGACLLLGVAFFILHCAVSQSGHQPIPCTQ